ncbi:glycoside hydrolase family 95 protein [Paraglaciecola aquimarina]|uniref:Glycoside hydrolase family 95 protein n=1 Tax=Paraglaciecola algarum TaxID=3050085 RepID=A0ABS9D2H5_9ALTE|nr:glycoside hydrolase family 95 protein [Paraglaciecola sp. G1-23]MCF2946650.1 glycoside hydrolase family 95 protein [Paraglaciecola sp. G1-23]
MATKKIHGCLVFCLCIVITWGRSALADPGPQTLWYNEPASQWEAAFPIGNGRLGAMVYGGVATETIQLNEDTFWAGGPHNNLNVGAKEALPEIRRLLSIGDYDAASKMAEKHITSQGAQGMPYQSAGVLNLEFSGHQNYTHYYRELDLENALTTTRYQIDDVKYQREVFSSFVDNVIIIHLTASEKNALNFSISLSHPDEMPVSVITKSASLLMQGTSIDHEGIKGQVKLANLVKIVKHDGQIEQSDQSLNITNASDVIIVASLATNFNNYKDINANALRKAENYLYMAEKKLTGVNKAYQSALQEHTQFYQEYFNRVSLNLGSNSFVKEPTDIRIKEFANRYDPSLVALYFQFGRYLLISSSQPGSQAANLQGIWNPHSTPPWDSKYTLNINFEMNYWPTEVTQLTELNEPYIRLVRELAESGREAAEKMYGARGWMAHHNTDIWRISGAIDWSWGSWPTSNAWLVEHLWQKYLYSGDETHLKSIYPIMKGACEFFEDFLVLDEKTGWLIVSPSMSPENPAPVTGQKIAAGVTLDNQLLFDLFSHSIRAAKILNLDNSSIQKWQGIIDKLPPMQIGKYHQLQEWLQDWDDPEDHHRHVSHLYGLYPSNLISPIRTPELFNAAKVSLEQRGDPSTGWSMNWKINLWARLLNGNRALKLIKDQIQLVKATSGEAGGTYPNMFDAHPPFQIDGNFGFTSGVVEMLIQSHDGSIHLLPALPEVWPAGEVKGLVARGGFIVDIKWQNGEVNYLKVTSRLGGNLRLRTYAPLPKEQGFKTTIATGSNSNPFYELPKDKPFIKHTNKNLPTLSLDNSFLSEINTKAGQSYIWGQ